MSIGEIDLGGVVDLGLLFGRERVGVDVRGLELPADRLLLGGHRDVLVPDAGLDPGDQLVAGFVDLGGAGEMEPDPESDDEADHLRQLDDELSDRRLRDGAPELEQEPQRRLHDVATEQVHHQEPELECRVEERTQHRGFDGGPPEHRVDDREEHARAHSTETDNVPRGPGERSEVLNCRTALSLSAGP